MGESSDLLDLINYSDYRLGHSLDSSDGSQGQPYPSPGSLCGLDRLAALGTMGPAAGLALCPCAVLRPRRPHLEALTAT